MYGLWKLQIYGLWVKDSHLSFMKRTIVWIIYFLILFPFLMVSTKAYREHRTHGSSVLKGLYDFVQNQFWSGFELILACLCLKLGICFSYFHWLWAQSMSGPSSPRPCGLRCSMWQTPGCGGWHYEVSCICSSERCRARHPCPHMARHPSWWYHRLHPQRRAVGTRISWSHDEGQFPQHWRSSSEPEGCWK